MSSNNVQLKVKQKTFLDAISTTRAEGRKNGIEVSYKIGTTPLIK